MEHSLVVSFTGVLVPQLRNETYLDINQNVESWIASIHGTSIFLGALITPFIMYRYGRRKANLINAIIMIVGWLCVMLAPGTNMILFGRFIQGIALGISSLSSAMLVGEYTSPKYRGAFLTAMTLTISIGNLIIHTLGSFLPWRTTAMICLGITIVDLIVIIISPESPVFLAARGREIAESDRFHERLNKPDISMICHTWTLERLQGDRLLD
ncbi:facilitated trehalose transporter Tret1-like, partial [Achroia grisella]|uniref:facilitated trehalose transporter Tret1-like n=1 Tax=Achroia grisella TaxID=688607 RepID=UPI0027D31DE7